MQYLATALAASAALFNSARALNTIEVQAQEFIDTTSGKRFEIIGIDYQPGGSSAYTPTSGTDVLTEPSACLRDAALMQQLGVNCIRVYNLNPYVNHDQCVSIFNQAGIYMILDVNTAYVNEAIDAAAPWTSYDDVYLNRTFAMIDAFSGYPNTLGFFSANELIQTSQNAAVDPPYIRAVTRDMKQYMQARGGRQVPIGYSAADYRDVLVDTANYVSCTINGSTTQDNINSGRSDFFGLNSYSWCGDSNFVTSTYNQLVADFSNTTMPVFFSEYGCNKVEPRTFTEVPVLYGSQMTTWSGGLVYQWTQDSNDYGLVTINSDGSISILVDYDNLQTQFNTLDLSILESQNETATGLTFTECSDDLINGDIFSASGFALPTQPPGVSSLIASGAPGAATGSIVSVTETMVSVVVTAYNGAVTSSLSITSASSANVPSGATGSATATASNVGSGASSVAGTATAASGSATSSSSGAAAPRATGANAALVGAGAAGLFLFALA